MATETKVRCFHYSVGCTHLLLYTSKYRTYLLYKSLTIVKLLSAGTQPCARLHSVRNGLSHLFDSALLLERRKGGEEGRGRERGANFL